MKTKRLARILLWIAGLIVVLVLVLAIGIKFLLTGDRIKALVVPRVEKNLGRKL